MGEIELIQQLDQAVDAMIRDPGAPLASDDVEIAELLSIAAELRNLPREGFKTTLKNKLEEEISMSAQAKSIQSADQPAHSKIQEGFRTVTPYLVVPNLHEEIEFLKKVFGAEGKIYGIGSAGGFHSEYKIGDSMLMIGGGGKGSAWKGTPLPTALHLYVADVDAAYERAMEAGAVSLMPPTDHDYGERSAGIEDPGGNHWYVATSSGPHYIAEGVHNLMPYFHPHGAAKMIDFLKRAFGAEEINVYKSPDGVVHHAKIRIGDSIVEMGEAHGRWQPMPSMFMLYVDDVDAWYARAMKAEGAVSVSEPAKQPYAGRGAAVKDPFGNTWHMATGR